MLNHSAIKNYCKGLILDGVSAANSGHPGGALSSLDLMYELFTEWLVIDPGSVNYPERDRFVLSAGHESMLIYTFLFLQGHLSVEDLKNFRQYGSRTPGHPENHVTPGVECCTGPLGQGAAMSVGMAIAARHRESVLAQKRSTRTYALLGDGCIQEDVTMGAASLAGHLKLSNLLWIYDKNRVQISGNISRCTSDDDAAVYRGFGWDVQTIDGHDPAAIHESFRNLDPEKPHLIIANTTMAKSSVSMEGKHKAHGAPFPEEEVKACKQAWGLNPAATFAFPEDLKQQWQNYVFERCLPKLTDTPETFLPVKSLSKINWSTRKSKLATRESFGILLEAWCEEHPGLIGGSADLEPSNMTGPFAKKVRDFSATDPNGRNINFGVREFPMAAVVNGIHLYDPYYRPFAATFLCFSDYLRPALRLGALQRGHAVYEFTHDSFYLGEDGPTHQPVEHVMSLRTIPGVTTIRPADSVETEVYFREALLADEGVFCFALSRQSLPTCLANTENIPEENRLRGAYVVSKKTEHKETAIIFATGSEVATALEVADRIADRVILKVVSVPSWEIFALQDLSYQNEILDWEIQNRFSLEAGVSLGWERFIGRQGHAIALDRFGSSGKAEDLAKAFGFDAESVSEKILSAIHAAK